MLKSICNTYHARRGDKAPAWCCNFADIVQDFDEKRWKTIFYGIEPKSNIIVFLKTSVLTLADNERVLDMREPKMGDEYCVSIDSYDYNAFA